MSRLLLLCIIAFATIDMHGQKANVQMNRILIINAFDADTLHVRKNKKDLFRELADSLQIYLIKHLNDQGLEASILPGLNNSSDDISIPGLLLSQHAAHAIVIRSMEVYFREGTEKRREEYGFDPKIETSYDLCSKIDYSLYINGTSSKDSQLVDCAYFTSRSQQERTFTIKFGPDIVGKKKHTYGAVDKNAALYIGSVLPMLK